MERQLWRGLPLINLHQSHPSFSFYQPITLRNDGEDPVFDPSVVHFAHELCK